MPELPCLEDSSRDAGSQHRAQIAETRAARPDTIRRNAEKLVRAGRHVLIDAGRFGRTHLSLVAGFDGIGGLITDRSAGHALAGRRDRERVAARME